MNMTDYGNITVNKISAVVKADVPPVGTQIRRIALPGSSDRLFCCFGSGSIQTWESGQTEVCDGDVVLIPGELAYTDNITAPGYAIIVYADYNVRFPDGIYKWTFPDAGKAKQSFQTILNLSRQQKPGYHVQMMRETYSVLYGIIKSERAAKYTTSAQAAMILPAVEYMKANFQDPELTIPSLACRCKLSYSHFRKLFSDVHGMSASRYLQELRLDYACQLLRLGDYSVAETARMSGFGDIYYFSKFFRYHTGTTPTEYQMGCFTRKKDCSDLSANITNQH